MRKSKLLRLQYKLVEVLQKHRIFATIVAVLLVAVAVAVRISMLNSLPIDQDYIDDNTNTLKPVRFDQSAIEKMEELQESNVRVPGAELPTDRDNPFSE